MKSIGDYLIEFFTFLFVLWIGSSLLFLAMCFLLLPFHRYKWAQNFITGFYNLITFNINKK